MPSTSHSSDTMYRNLVTIYGVNLLCRDFTIHLKKNQHLLNIYYVLRIVLNLFAGLIFLIITTIPGREN